MSETKNIQYSAKPSADKWFVVRRVSYPSGNTFNRVVLTYHSPATAEAVASLLNTLKDDESAKPWTTS